MKNEHNNLERSESMQETYRKEASNIQKPWQGMTLIETINYWTSELEISNRQFASLCDLNLTIIDLLEEKNGTIKQEYLYKILDAFEILENGWYAAYLSSMYDIENDMSVAEKVECVNLKIFLLELQKMNEQDKKELLERISYKTDYIMSDRDVPLLTKKEVEMSISAVSSALKPLAGMTITGAINFYKVELELSNEDFAALCELEPEVIESIINDNKDIKQEVVYKILNTLDKLEEYLDVNLDKSGNTKNKTL